MLNYKKLNMCGKKLYDLNVTTSQKMDHRSNYKSTPRGIHIQSFLRIYTTEGSPRNNLGLPVLGGTHVQLPVALRSPSLFRLVPGLASPPPPPQNGPGSMHRVRAAFEKSTESFNAARAEGCPAAALFLMSPAGSPPPSQRPCRQPLNHSLVGPTRL